MKRGRAVLLGTAVLAAAAAGTVAGLAQLHLKDLPQIRFLEEYRPSTSTRLLDRKGRLIGELYVERRKPIHLSQVSPLFVKAILAVEDERFFDHVGVDLKAILRALLADLRARDFAQGGSTITQQLTRTLFLESDKSVGRKIKEAILAIQIENRYTKQEILELYCNQIYLGGGVYGVQAAAQRYFGVDAADLTLPQAALVAGLPQRPSAYDPVRNPARARQRRSVVLRRMLSAGAIAPADYAAADQAPLGIVESVRRDLAPHFTDRVRQYLEETYGSGAVYQQGLEVRTTLDLDLQRAAERALRQGLERLDKESGLRETTASLPPPDERLVPEVLGEGTIFPARVTEVAKRFVRVAAGTVSGVVPADRDVFPYLASFSGRFQPGQTVLVRVASAGPWKGPVPLVLEQVPALQGALLALDPRDGHVLAMVGGYDFAVSQFNRAVQARRQPGSAIKPFIYAAAMEAGYTPASVIEDEPIRFWDEAEKDWWEPQNYDQDFVGNITLIEALTHSRNVVTVKLLNHLGTAAATRLIRRLGVQSPMGPNLSLALGTSVLTLEEVTSAYGVLAAGGIRCPPLQITAVLDHQGRTLETREPQYARVLEPGIAAVVVEMLRSVVNFGTGRVARDVGFPVAAKTGTTNDYQDAWFVGFSPELACGVWVGYDDNHSMGRGATGSRMAGPIWADFMRQARPGAPDTDFRLPDDVVLREIDVSTGLLCPEGRRAAFLRGTEPTRGCVPE